MRSTQLVLTLMTCAATSYGQLHLLTGSPYSRGNAAYPSAIHRVDNNGNVKKVFDLADSGLEWIGVSYDARVAVLLGSWERAIIVVGFEAIVKKCEFPHRDPTRFIRSWLADSSSTGPAFEWLQSSDLGTAQPLVYRMDLDARTPCSDSFSNVEQEAIRYAVAHGHPGIADLVNWDGIPTIIEEDGTLIAGVVHKRVPLGYTVPRELLANSELRVSGMAINESAALVLTIGDGKETFRSVAFRKTDRTWHILPVQIGEHLRGFGEYIAGVEADTSAAARDWPSAGIAKWRSGRDGVRPDLRERLAALNSHRPLFYPGRLQIYDLDSEQLYTINTGQGDSEVLLIEAGVVYYRAADQLYSASIDTAGIGRPRLIATDDSIRDAHWAFIKH